MITIKKYKAINNDARTIIPIDPLPGYHEPQPLPGIIEPLPGIFPAN